MEERKFEVTVAQDGTLKVNEKESQSYVDSGCLSVIFIVIAVVVAMVWLSQFLIHFYFINEIVKIVLVALSLILGGISHYKKHSRFIIGLFAFFPSLYMTEAVFWNYQQEEFTGLLPFLMVIALLLMVYIVIPILTRLIWKVITENRLKQNALSYEKIQADNKRKHNEADVYVIVDCKYCKTSNRVAPEMKDIAKCGKCKKRLYKNKDK